MKDFLQGFDLQMFAEAFNLTGEAARKMLVTFVNVGTTSLPVWEAQGYKVEDSAIDFNPDTTTITDILGDTYTDVNKFEESQTLEPSTLRMGAGLAENLHQIWRDQDLEKFSQFEVALVYGYLGTTGAYEADIWKTCTIYPNSIGGSSRVDFPFTINLGGEKVKAISTGLRTGATITPAP